MRAGKLFYNFSIKVNNNPYIMVIKNASIKMLPLIVVIAFCTFATSVLTAVWPQGDQSIAYDLLWKVRTALMAVFPYTFVFLFSTYLSQIKKRDVDLLTALSPTIALMIFNIIVDGSLIVGTEIKFLRSIIIGILSYEFTHFLNRKFKSIKLFKSNQIINLNLAVQQIISSILCIMLITIISYVFHKNKIFMDLDPSINIEFTNSIWIALKYTTLTIIPWFLGINGSHVVSSSFEKLYQNLLYNQNLAANGLNDFRFIDQGFYDLYIHIGGSGATFCLLIALFLSKRKSHRSFAEISLIPSLVNINEILIYGFPIVANIQMLIPFLLVPLLFTALTYIALTLGIIPVVIHQTSWLTPPIINAFLSCQGDYRVVVWQIFLISIGTLIYMYFLKQYDSLNEFEFKNNFKFLSRDNLDGNFSETQINILSEISDAKASLKELLDGGEFILFFQPIRNMHTNKIEKLEALIRINHDKKGIIPPYFLKYFKTLKLLSDIDYWVIKKSFEYQKKLEKMKKEISISINISADTFVEEKFISKVKELMDEYSINPKNIVLELVEEICLYDISLAKDKIHKLKELGLRVSIDDFGTGYSSLSYLLDLDVDFIKIDRKFVLGLQEEKGKKLLENIILLSKSLGFKTIIEGVETEEQLKLVDLYQSDYVQGYYYSKPDSFENIIDYIDNN